MKPNGGPAFPQTWHPDMRCHPSETPAGMSLRDYFAAAALKGNLAASKGVYYDLVNIDERADLARYCYSLADAMIEEREKK